MFKDLFKKKLSININKDNHNFKLFKPSVLYGPKNMTSQYVDIYYCTNCKLKGIVYLWADKSGPVLFSDDNIIDIRCDRISCKDYIFKSIL